MEGNAEDMEGIDEGMEGTRYVLERITYCHVREDE